MASFAVFLLTPLAILVCAVAIYLRALRVVFALPLAGTAAFLGSPFLATSAAPGMGAMIWLAAFCVLTWAACEVTKLR